MTPAPSSAGPVHGKLVLIMGPSGVGKSVILQKLRATHPEIRFPRSATTRKRRPQEGDDLYRFVDDAQFDALLADNQFLEWAVVHGGARYGTLLEEIIPYIERGQTVLREVDVQGFDSIRKSPLFSGDAPPYRLQSVFILPESKEQLIAHITKRAPIAKEELDRRVASMEKELAFAEHCDVRVTNREGKIAEALAELERVIAG
jgi:guanylate kinase